MNRKHVGPVRVGVVGCGMLARSVHLPNLARMQGVEVIALADTEAAGLAAAGQLAPRASHHSAPDGLLAREDVEAVLISTPPATHADLALAALAAGKHVYVEKPLATSLADAERLLAAWRATGLVGMVGFTYRFHRLVVEARERLRGGAIGEIVAARSVFSTGRHDLPAWKRSAATGGGPLLDLVSHDADLVRFVLGREVREVFATGGAGEDPDTVSLLLRIDGGIPVQLQASLGSVEEAVLEVYGRTGMVAVDRYASLRLRLSGIGARGPGTRLAGGAAELARLPYLLSKLHAPAGEPAFRAALEAFAAAVRGSGPAEPDLLDGFRSLAVVAAAEESLQTGGPARPAEAPGA